MKCQVDEMSSRWNVKSMKCQVDEMRKLHGGVLDVDECLAAFIPALGDASFFTFKKVENVCWERGEKNGREGRREMGLKDRGLRKRWRGWEKRRKEEKG